METTTEPIAYWHYHHSQYLLEFPDETEESRRKFIDTGKDPLERPLRKRLFKKVRGDLPADFARAVADYYHAGADVTRARADYYRAIADYYRAIADYERARADYYHVYQSVLPQIEALHAKECPDCPWDGKTIFTRKNENGEWY